MFSVMIWLENLLLQVLLSEFSFNLKNYLRNIIECDEDDWFYLIQIYLCYLFIF